MVFHPAFMETALMYSMAWGKIATILTQQSSVEMSSCLNWCVTVPLSVTLGSQWLRFSLFQCNWLPYEFRAGPLGQ